MRIAVLSITVAAIVLVGCPKKAPNGDDASASASGARADADADQGVILGGNAKPDVGAGAASAASTVGTASSWVGKYTVSAGTMYVPEHKDWSSVKFKNDDAKLLGDGTLSLAVDPSGRVSGATESGPLGVAIIDGTSEGGTLTATIRRKDLADQGLTGTLVAKVSGDALEGTMKLAEANAAVVRVGKLEAKKK